MAEVTTPPARAAKAVAPAVPAVPDKPTAGPSAGPVAVFAKKDGTYPRPGDTYPVYRKAGEAFTLNDPAHFAPEWMKRIEAGDVVALDPEPVIPQTTGRHKTLITHAPLP